MGVSQMRFNHIMRPSLSSYFLFLISLQPLLLSFGLIQRFLLEWLHFDSASTKLPF